LIRLRSILGEAAQKQFASLDDFLAEKTQKEGINFDLGLEQGMYLSTILMIMVNDLIFSAQYSYASYALWTAWRFNPENVECNLLLQKIGIYIPLSLEDVTVQLTVYFKKL